jgi:hypothetical protein
MATFILSRFASAAGRRQKSIFYSPIVASLSSSATPSTTAVAQQASDTKRSRSISLPTALALVGGSLLGGYCLGTSHTVHWKEIQKDRELPKGERGCCSCDDGDAPTATPTSPKVEFTEAQIQLSSKLSEIAGKNHVYDGMKETSKNAHFLQGARLGQGTALCIGK